MPVFFYHNGKPFEAGSAIIGPESRAMRYGDGIFETIRIHNGKIPLWDRHFNRLSRGLQALKLSLPAHLGQDKLALEITQLAARNHHLPHARVRMSFFRGDGGLFDPVSPITQYIIQTWELPEHYRSINENGLALCVYRENRKPVGPLSNLKTNSALLYVLAALHAKEQRCNEALVLNEHGSIADASISNIFWLEGDQVCTTPLRDGGVAGVMREAVMDRAQTLGRPVIEKTIHPEALANADGVFLTNALYGLRWVGSLEDKRFQPALAGRLYQEWISPLFP